MSQRIYDAQVSTAAGMAAVRITDTVPTANTPEVSRRPPEGEVELRMGDGGEQAEGLPTSLGSYFELQIPDPDRTFQDLFRSVFDDRRFTVELDVPAVGTWHGYVKSTLQTRPASRRTRAGVTLVNCFDGLSLLKEEDTAVNARTMTVQEILAEAFAEANPDLDIVARVDVEARTIDNDVVGLESLRPVAGNPQFYEPITPDGPGEEAADEGLEGDSLRAQLNDLCNRLGAVAYQDVRLNAWAFMDFPSIGASVGAKRYDGSSWSSFAVPGQTVSVASADIADEGPDAYKTQPSVRAVCTTVKNWVTDPGFEGVESDGDLHFWALSQAERTSEGKITETDSSGAGGTAEQTIDLSDLDVYDSIIAIRALVDVPAEILLTITFGNGDTETNASGTPDQKRVYIGREPTGGHSSIDEVTVEVLLEDQDLGHVEVNFLLATAGDPSGPGDTTAVPPSGDGIRWRVVETVCYTADDETGRTTVESDAGGFLTVLSDGSEVPATEWQSKRYASSPYRRFSRWRAVNLLALRPPPYERLDTDVLGSYVPLGTRVQVTKPGDTEPTVFVPLKSRELSLGPGEAVTTLKDVEVPADVVELV